MGPVITAAQRARCEHFVALAIEHGGRVAAGGKRPAHLSRGYYFEPTLLDLPDNRNPAAQEEIFGPVVSVIGNRDLDHAVAMRSEEHTSELQSLMRISYAVFCLKQKTQK